MTTQLTPKGSTPMISGRRQRTRKGLAFTVISLSAATMAGALVATDAFAADGPQSPAPVLTPAPVASAATNFTLSNDSCDGTGGAGWRVQTFIVNSGVDLSTLTFLDGVGFDQVGTDRDNADGTIRSPLFKDNAPGTGFSPAASPAGLINPADLQSFDFSAASWVLTDGAYQIGYACLDEQSELRQWWSVAVTVDADASSGSFLVVGADTGTTTTTINVGASTTSTTAAGATTTTTTTGGGTTSTTTTGGATTSTIASGEVTTTTGGSAGTTSTTRASGVLSAQSTQGTGSSSLPATGQGLAIAGVGLFLVYLGRVGYLLGRPGRR